jgi:signal transduction histidine kinase/ActR/RegA family two-component response regulator
MTRAWSLFRRAQAPRSPYAAPAFFFFYLVAAGLAYALTHGQGGLATLWINNGLLAAALLLLPRRDAAPLAIACTITDFLCALLSGSPPAQALLISVADLSESILAALLIRRFCGAALDVTILSRLRNLVLFAAIPAALIVGTAATAASSLLFAHDFRHVWPAWVGGDALGMVIGAPATLLMARYRRHQTSIEAHWLERVGLVLLLPLMAGFIFLFAPEAMLFLVFPLGLLAILRLNASLAILGVLLFAFVATAATVTGHGPIASSSGDISKQILLLQFYLALAQLSALVLVSVLAERTRAQNSLKRALSLSRDARREALAAAGAKGRFLAVMSHEMRTPLNGIAGHAQILDMAQDLPERAREQIRTIRTSCDLLLSLINDVLDYSRTESHQLELSQRPLSLAEIIDQTVKIVEPLLADRPVRLVTDCAALQNRWHLGDERRLAQVLMNLVGNAIKFTAKGSISIRAEVRPGPGRQMDTVKLSVIDTGIGIDPDHQALLFQPFSQVETGMTRNVQGAGLGLAISRSLIELMEGQIGVVSRPGEGSEFWFSVSLTRAQSRAVKTPAVRANSGRSRKPTSRGVPQILVVDDHEVNRRVAELMLEAAGFSVATAQNGEEAVQAVREGAFDLVLMDLHMPVKDGLTACREIRALAEPLCQTPIIAMTAAAMPDDIARCRAAGMEEHIAKPIRREDLILSVRRATTLPPALS